MATTPVLAPASSPEMTGHSPKVAFAVNLNLLITGGTWPCFWLLHYKDKFDDFAKVLVLGDGLTWLAFVLKVLPDEPFRAPNILLLQQSFEHSIWGPFSLKLIANEGRVGRHGLFSTKDTRANRFPEDKNGFVPH